MTYEYLLAGLPELKAGSDAPISLEKLEELLDECLVPSDKAMLDLLRAPMDEKTLEQGLQSPNRFVRAWFGFNQDMNNVLVAQICRKHGFDPKQQIVGQGEVAEHLRTHTTQKDFGLGEVMDEYQEILALAQIENLMDREKAKYSYLGVNEDNKEQINVTAKGDNKEKLEIKIFFHEDLDSVSMRSWYVISFDKANLAKVLAAVNKLNNDYKYVKFVVDESDYSVDAEIDCPLRDDDCAGEIAYDALYYIEEIVDRAYPELKAFEKK